MRMGVLDIGSNTGHLAVFDAESGRPPVRVHKFRKMLRLADRVDGEGALTDDGLEDLLAYTTRARAVADEQGVDVLPVATATIRDAPNRAEILAAVREASGFDLSVLSREKEAQLTFLAARRWIRWSGRAPGRIGVVDLGGGSLEIAAGRHEAPEDWGSWRLGAGRLTREWVGRGRAPAELRRYARAEIEPHVDRLVGDGLDLAVGTSRTMRMLGSLCGEPVRKGDLTRLVEQVAGMEVSEITELPGVPKERADQVLAGSIVADVVMDLFSLDELEICPWALREGVLLQHLDHL